MSFMDPQKVAYQHEVDQARDHLAGQTEQIQVNSETLANLKVQFRPEDVLHLRLETLIEYLLPDDGDEHHNFTNLRRMRFETQWNDALLIEQGRAILFGHEQAILDEQALQAQKAEQNPRGKGVDTDGIKP